MHTTVLRRVGGSVMLSVPPTVLDILGLQAGAKVGVAVEGGRLIVEPRRRPVYRLEELLAQCDPGGEIADEDRDWLEGGACGGELI